MMACVVNGELSARNDAMDQAACIGLAGYGRQPGWMASAVCTLLHACMLSHNHYHILIYLYVPARP